MADAIEKLRNEAERDLRSLLTGLRSDHRETVRSAVSDWGSVSAVPESVWEGIRRDIDQDAAAILLLLMAGIYQTEGRRLRRQLPKERREEVSGLINDRERIEATASDAAARLGRETAERYVNGARRRLQRNIDGKAAELNRLPDDEARDIANQEIDDAFGEAPAEGTAATQTTRGITIGQDGAGLDIGRAANVRITTYWRTERDAKVCPICRPLDGRSIDQWENVMREASVDPEAAARIMTQLGPPAHPNCRCELRQSIAVESNN